MNERETISESGSAGFQFHLPLQRLCSPPSISLQRRYCVVVGRPQHTAGRVTAGLFNRPVWPIDLTSPFTIHCSLCTITAVYLTSTHFQFVTTRHHRHRPTRQMQKHTDTHIYIQTNKKTNKSTYTY